MQNRVRRDYSKQASKQREKEGERHRERGGEGQTDRQTDRRTDGQTDRQRHTEREAPAHTSLKRAGNRDFRWMKTAARHRKHVSSTVLGNKCF